MDAAEEADNPQPLAVEGDKAAGENVDIGQREDSNDPQGSSLSNVSDGEDLIKQGQVRSNTSLSGQGEGGAADEQTLGGAGISEIHHSNSEASSVSKAQGDFEARGKDAGANDIASDQPVSAHATVNDNAATDIQRDNDDDEYGDEEFISEHEAPKSDDEQVVPASVSEIESKSRDRPGSSRSIRSCSSKSKSSKQKASSEAELSQKQASTSVSANSNCNGDSITDGDLETPACIHDEKGKEEVETSDSGDLETCLDDNTSDTGKTVENVVAAHILTDDKTIKTADLTVEKKNTKKAVKKTKKPKKIKAQTASAYAIPKLKAKPKRGRTDQGFGLYGNASLIRPVRESLRLSGQFGCEKPVLSPRLLHSDALASTSGNTKCKARAKELRKELAKAQMNARTNESDQMDSAYAWQKDATSDIMASEEGSRTMAIPDEIAESAEEESKPPAPQEKTEEPSLQSETEIDSMIMTVAEKEEFEVLSKKIDLYTKDLARIKELSSILRKKTNLKSKSKASKTKYKAELASAKAAADQVFQIEKGADAECKTELNDFGKLHSNQKDLVEMYGQLENLMNQLKMAKARLGRIRAKSAQRQNRNHDGLSSTLSSGHAGARSDNCALPDHTRPDTCPGLTSPGGFSDFGFLDGPDISWTEVKDRIESRALMFEQRLQREYATEQEKAHKKESNARSKIEQLGGIIEYINNEMPLDSPPQLQVETGSAEKGSACASPKKNKPASSPVKTSTYKVQVLSHRRKASVDLAESKKLAALSPLSRLANPSASFAANLPSSIRDPLKLSKAQTYLLQPVRTIRRTSGK